MARKPMYEGGTEKKFVEEATKLFFNQGYEGTSIRGICKEVKCEVGLFYYYYKSKDELFDICLEEFFIPYKAKFQGAVDGAKATPENALAIFFDCLKAVTREFRDKYAPNMHKGTRLAIREYTLTAIEPYIAQIIEFLKDSNVNAVVDDKLASVILAHGVGGVILHEDSDWVDASTEGIQKIINLIMGV